MLQDSLKYEPKAISQPDSQHQAMPVLGPLKPFLPDSLQQGIPPYANPFSKPTDSIFARLELNPFFRALNESSVPHVFKGKPVHTEKSIFTYNQLHPVNLEPVLKNDVGYNWLTGILILCFVVYTITQFLYSKRLIQIFKAAFARRYISQLVREGGLFKQRITLALLFIFFTTSSIFIFQFIRYNLNIEFTHPELTYCAIFVGLLLFWTFKVLVIKLLGFSFKTESSSYEYNLTGLIFYEIIGVILLPFTLPAIFQNPALFSKVGLLIILIGLVLNLSRGFMVGLKNTKFSFFYLILYLCTLEILPLVVAIKIFINH